MRWQVDLGGSRVARRARTPFDWVKLPPAPRRSARPLPASRIMKDDPARVYLLAPTFREPGPVAKLLRALSGTEYQGWTLLLVNCSPGDETSALVRTCDLGPRVRELAGHPGLFWSGAQNVGLRVVLQEAGENDLVVLINVDIDFGPQFLGSLLALHQEHPRAQLGALSCHGNRVVSSGVQVRSWMLALTRHPYSGWDASRVPGTGVVPVDLLPTRCVLFPVAAVRAAGLIREKWLPHYGADYEFTRRLGRAGYGALLCLGIRLESDITNTGNDLYSKQFTLISRIRRLFHIKSSFNPVHRISYVVLTYPWWAVPTAAAMYLVKTFAEVLLGGRGLRRVLSGTGHGFS